MNVANLELCRELYIKTGWDDTMWSYTASENGDLVLLNEHEYHHLPAYDLGYVLRKLPSVYRETDGVGWILKLEISDGTWFCYYAEGVDGLFQRADTPEDAACKLAIELFKQGILTKGSAPEGSGGDIG